jgi:polar amino acid transport system substrate-binding protein
MILECELEDDLPEVSANPFSLEEVVLNLISNARDATAERLKQAPGAAPARIVLATRAEPAGDQLQVVVEVTDQGVGIPPEMLARVFDPFFTTKSPEKGTGLGLSISKSIVESFGGAIRIRSTPGSGTTVSVFLPALASGRSERSKAKESP